jgi:hypothetical protein
MGLEKMIMDRITIVKDFLSKDECSLTLECLKYGKLDYESDAYKKLNDYIDTFIKLKGYEFSKPSPIKLNIHNTSASSLKWNTDVDSYITILIQLNDSYEEGYLQFLTDDGDNYFQLHHGAGHMVVFFSNLKQRTSPVINGIKYTMTTTISIKQLQDYKPTII